RPQRPEDRRALELLPAEEQGTARERIDLPGSREVRTVLAVMAPVAEYVRDCIAHCTWARQLTRMIAVADHLTGAPIAAGCARAASREACPDACRHVSGTPSRLGFASRLLPWPRFIRQRHLESADNII